MAKILIVDDDSAVQATIRLLLERAGHSVVVAADGRKGLAVFEAGDFDLLFLDIFMPGMDGLETMRLVHQQQPLIPIIVISGNPMTSESGSGPDFLTMASRLGVEFSRQPFCDSLVPCLLGDAIDGINAARQMPTDQPIQCSRISKAGNVGRRVAHVGLKIGGDQPRMRLGAIEDTRRNHLLQAAIAQPSDSGHRDRNQRNHRDGQSGCKRHVCFRAISGPLARCLASWTGSNITGCRG